VSAGWIALSNSFPMLFDENYHLGVIDIYSRQISPFLTSQPDEAKFYGDITRDPSYLYWYLFSFIYNFIGIFTDNIITVIISLRFINIAIVAVSLVFWRKLLFQLSLSRAQAHLALFLFVSVPLVPYLAAHINYDNLVLLILPILFSLIIKLQTTKQPLVCLLLAAGLAGMLSVVKFSTLPIVVVVAVAALVILLRRFGKAFGKELYASRAHSKKITLIGAILVGVLGLGLFAERYGVNYVQYSSYSPDCIELHSFDECKEYSVWIRNFNAENRTDTFELSLANSPPAFFFGYWVPNIYGGLFVSGAFTDATTDLHRFMPQNVSASTGSLTARLAGAGALLISLFALARSWKYLSARGARYLILTSFLLYGAALFATNYGNLVNLGYPYATQGRYMIPFIIPVIGLLILGLGQVFRNKPLTKTVLLIIFLLCFLQAAGALTYIVYSNPSWQWEFGPFREWNTTLRTLLSPFLKH